MARNNAEIAHRKDLLEAVLRTHRGVAADSGAGIERRNLLEHVPDEAERFEVPAALQSACQAPGNEPSSGLASASRTAT